MNPLLSVWLQRVATQHSPAGEWQAWDSPPLCLPTTLSWGSRHSVMVLPNWVLAWFLTYHVLVLFGSASPTGSPPLLLEVEKLFCVLSNACVFPSILAKTILIQLHRFPICAFTPIGGPCMLHLNFCHVVMTAHSTGFTFHTRLQAS